MSRIHLYGERSRIHLYGERSPPPPPPPPEKKSDFYSDCDAIVKLDDTSVFRLSAKMLGRITDNNLFPVVYDSLWSDYCLNLLLMFSDNPESATITRFQT